MGLVLAGILLPVQITLVRNVRTLLGVTPGAFVEFIPMVGAVVLILAPLCVLTGFLFTLGTRLTVEQGQAAGQAYVWEGVGAVVGGTLFSFLLIRWLDPYQTALLVTTVNLTVVILWLSLFLDNRLFSITVHEQHTIRHHALFHIAGLSSVIPPAWLLRRIGSRN